MFDVKKLAKLLKEIFTRDNVNFSPELVAKEIEDRKLEVVECKGGCECSSPIASFNKNSAVGATAWILYHNTNELAHHAEEWPSFVSGGNKIDIGISAGKIFPDRSGVAWFYGSDVPENDGWVTREMWRDRRDEIEGYDKQNPSTWHAHALKQLVNEHDEWPAKHLNKILMTKLPDKWASVFALGIINLRGKDGLYKTYLNGVEITEQEFIDAKK